MMSLAALGGLLSPEVLAQLQALGLAVPPANATGTGPVPSVPNVLNGPAAASQALAAAPAGVVPIGPYVTQPPRVTLPGAPAAPGRAVQATPFGRQTAAMGARQPQPPQAAGAPNLSQQPPIASFFGRGGTY